MSISISKLTQAIVFAAEKHKNQRRKDGLGTPYINHPLRVLNILTTYGMEQYSFEWELPILIAAVLHDTVEDTDATIEEIVNNFGVEVANIVAEVTDDKSLPKRTRKKLQVEHAPNKSKSAKLVKLADKLDNLRDLEQTLPVEWTEEMRFGYFVWTYEVVEGMRGTNLSLEQSLDRIFQRVGIAALSKNERRKHLKNYYLLCSEKNH